MAESKTSSKKKTEAKKKEVKKPTEKAETKNVKGKKKATGKASAKTQKKPAKMVREKVSTKQSSVAVKKSVVSKPSGKYFEGIGRRKRATCRVRLYKGKNPSIINNTLVEEYFVIDKQLANAVRPLKVVNLDGEYYFSAKANGGGIAGQSDAVSLGLARALVEMDSTFKPLLKKEGLMTRDPRVVERKKPGLRKARKKPQFSKR